MRALGFKYKVCKKGFYVVCHEKHASEKISKGWMGKAKGMLQILGNKASLMKPTFSTTLLRREWMLME
jgi:hypothetical protein